MITRTYIEISDICMDRIQKLFFILSILNLNLSDSLYWCTICWNINHFTILYKCGTKCPLCFPRR